MSEYQVEDFSLGDKINGDKIIFKSVSDILTYFPILIAIIIFTMLLVRFAGIRL